MAFSTLIYTLWCFMYYLKVFVSSWDSSLKLNYETGFTYTRHFKGTIFYKF
jgi:hypothetical protein